MINRTHGFIENAPQTMLSDEKHKLKLTKS